MADRNTEAEPLLREAHATAPGDLEITARLAYCLIDLGRRDEVSSLPALEDALLVFNSVTEEDLRATDWAHLTRSFTEFPARRRARWPPHAAKYY
jgi:thioredoxin-like negative regulator of GroEL